uniref:Peroxisomal membrane protein PEX14 n=1 Tax=Daphnia magna TaxID=35525 RepID=A0A4Y7MT35_9CRUS|nr:EOG090X0FQ8 [Daphnia magna]SVE81023.1 EOG090X0FQ8 [Daphnia magna]SVE82785.1 EOG090X0FQ8 [Daphnia magna]
MSNNADTLGSAHRQEDNSEKGNIQALREDLISTAVKFLQNPRVATRPKSEKESFLQRKGLNHAEIAAAFEAAGTKFKFHACLKQKDGTRGHYSSVKVAQLHEYSHALAPVATSKWGFFKEIMNAMILIAGAAYSLHYLYRRFIEPFLFGHKKKNPLEDTVEEMNKNLTCLVGNVSAAVQDLSDTVATLRPKQYEQSEIKELKAEMASLKAILLGRRQFPAPPPIVTGTPSIPSWQLDTSSGEKLNLRAELTSKTNQGDGVSLSSSPEIISVEDMPTNSTSLTKAGLSSVSPARGPSESSESNSAEMVEMGASGGSGEDTD